MSKKYFVKENSIVREIWRDTDNILFIFGACAGEFALSKSVDWLFFTGKLPSDPIGRLFSTVIYAQKIIFEEKTSAEKTLASINIIHKNVENSRGLAIPNWAYQDVLYMLIAHTISAFELLNRLLLTSEKEEIFDVFKRVGVKMGIQNLPKSFKTWKMARQMNLETNYIHGQLSCQLFDSYKLHLGSFRFYILSEVQKILLPIELKKMLFLNDNSRIQLFINIYKSVKHLWPINILKYYSFPKKHRGNLRKIAAFKS